MKNIYSHDYHIPRNYQILKTEAHMWLLGAQRPMRFIFTP